MVKVKIALPGESVANNSTYSVHSQGLMIPQAIQRNNEHYLYWQDDHILHKYTPVVARKHCEIR